MIPSQPRHNKWTRALWEPSAGVECSKECVALVDLRGADDHQLLLVDESDGWPSTKLKLFKGLRVEIEQALAEPPTGITGFRAEPTSTDSSPSLLAVASGSSLLIYRNMKPYYRFNLPSNADLLSQEIDLWASMSKGAVNGDQLADGLEHMRLEHGAKRLSFQAQQLLTLETDELKTRFVEHMRGQLKRSFSTSATNTPLNNVLITCLTTMSRNSTGVDVLIVGTEQASIYFIDAQAYTVLRRDSLPSSHVPVKLLPLGQYDLDYRLVVVTREPDVWFLRHNAAKNRHSQHSIYVREAPFDVVALSQHLLVFATRRRKLVFFSAKGKRQNAMEFTENITDIEAFSYEPKQFSGLLVAVGAELRLYHDQVLNDVIRIVDLPIEWVRCGRLGREEGVLVIATQGGGLCVKIFRRIATMEPSPAAVEETQKSQRVRPIEIPKKSRAFVEQSLRERENPQLIHQIYQRDWFMLRLHTAKTYAKLVSGETDLLPTNSDREPLQVTYDLLGFGPKFKLIVKMVASGRLEHDDRYLLFLFNSTEYELDRRITPVPSTLPPNRWFHFCVRIRCRHPDKQLQEEEAEARVMLVRKGASRPVWATSFVMPQSEPDLI